MSAQSGIVANVELSTKLVEAKQGSIRLLHMQIEDEQIQLRKVIPISGDWKSDFDKSIQPLLDLTNASYILYRLDSKNNLGYEWLLLTWIPNEAHVKQKTLYASTRNTFRRLFGEGYLADDILCHDKHDISLAGYEVHLACKKAPAPLTHAEAQAQEVASDQIVHASIDDGHSSMGGLAFGLTASSVQSVKEFADGKLNYLQFQIDIPKEEIFVSESKSNLKPEEIGTLIPPNTGSYQLYRFVHDFEGAKCSSVVFLHTIPGYQSPIKERMLYSSCKGNLIDCLTRHYGIDIQRRLEIDDFKELTSVFLIDTLHPKEVETPIAFARPKGPAGRGPRRLIR